MILKVHAPHCPGPPMPEPENPKAEFAYPLEKPQDLRMEQLQEQVHLSMLLNQINNQISGTLDLKEVLNSACQLLGKTLNCSRVSILVKQPENEEAFTTSGEYIQGDYLSQLGVQVPIEDNPHLKILMSQPGTVGVSRFIDFPGLGEKTKTLISSLSIQSMLAIATRYQGKVNGVVGLHQCDREREWTEWERQLLEGVASQLAIAINQAQLYTESRKQAEREALLRLLTNQIRSTLDLNTILQTAVSRVRQLLSTDRVVIYQFSENWQGEIVVEDLVVPWPSIFGEMVMDHCFGAEYAQRYQQGRVRAIHDIHKAGLNECHVNFLANLKVKANLIVPILIGEKLWGLLIAHECCDTRVWRTDEIELLRQLGDQMAIAIQQAELFKQVQESAAQSQAQAEQLQATLEELRSTQLQLIQSVKLSSLGQMVAGIAHEINNPNNFIYANLAHAQEYATDLLHGIELYTEAFPDIPESIQEFNDEVDLDYIRDDFPKVLKSMKEGSDRIRSIVLTLRNFSRLDEAESKSVNLNEGIESSLAMLQHRLKPDLTINKQYGNLPLVECRPGQINQVFYNLLQNSLDAIEENHNTGELTIRTDCTPDSVTISIRDNGPGIPLEIQDKIFDPFFTTKEPGKGTGLGLSLCYQVVVKGHSGQIRCISEPGQGAEFILELPLQTKG